MKNLHPMVNLRSEDFTPAAVAIAQIAIKADFELLCRFNTLHKLSDFKIREVVKCSFMPGLYKVYAINFTKNVAYIHKITENSENCVKVEPIFLEKAEIDQKMVKLLYGN